MAIYVPIDGVSHGGRGKRCAVEQLLAEGDLVTARVTRWGTQTWPFTGVAPTGRAVAFAAYHIVRFDGGNAVEWWGTAELVGALASANVRGLDLHPSG